MLLIDDGAGGVVGVRAGLRDYLRIHLTADRIDRDLAEGASPTRPSQLRCALRS